jgi:hypothetical protein
MVVELCYCGSELLSGVSGTVVRMQTFFMRLVEPVHEMGLCLQGIIHA